MNKVRRGVIWFLLAVTNVVTAASPAVAEEEDQARHHFQRGRDLEEGGDLAGALAEFQRAMELRPTFRLHRYMGRVCRGMGRLRVALDHYQAFLREGRGQLDPEERQEAAVAVAEIIGQLASLTITTVEGALVLVDGGLVGRAPLAEPVRLDPGAHLVEARLEGHVDARNQLDLAPGEELSLELDLAPRPATDQPPEPASAGAETVPEPGMPENEDASDLRLVPGEHAGEDRRRVHRGWFWAAFGLSAALLAAGGITGVMALVAQGEYDDLNRADRTDDDHQRLLDARDRVETLGPATDALLGIGAAAAVAALVLAFFTDFDGEPSPGTARLAPTIAPDGAVLSLMGAF